MWRLSHFINDAKAMANFLKAAGFEVLQAPNLSQSDMRKTIGNFANVVSEKGPDTVVLVFYAGHGLQVDGENFLVPVDAQIERESDVPLQAMRLADVMNMLSSVRSKSRFGSWMPAATIHFQRSTRRAAADLPSSTPRTARWYPTRPRRAPRRFTATARTAPSRRRSRRSARSPDCPSSNCSSWARCGPTPPINSNFRKLIADHRILVLPGAAGLERPSTVANKGQPSTPAASRSEARSVEAWQKELKSKGALEAYDIIVVREDKVEAYQAYLALYPSQPTTPVMRNLVDRRHVVIAWYNAVTINYGRVLPRLPRQLWQQRFRGNRQSPRRTSSDPVGVQPCRRVRLYQPGLPVQRADNPDPAPETHRSGDTGVHSQSDPPAKAAVTAVPPKTRVAVIDPTPSVRVYPVTPVVVPPRITVIPPKLPPRHDKPDYPSGNDKPGGGKHSQHPRHVEQRHSLDHTRTTQRRLHAEMERITVPRPSR
jgi:Caspase domain